MRGRRLLGAVLLLSFVLPRWALPAFAQREAPQLVGQLGGALSAVAITGHDAYVGTGRRFLALDVSDPTHPVPVKAARGFFLPAAIRGIATAGTLAYVADGAAGLHIVDISNPGEPVERGVLPGTAAGVLVSGSLALVRGDSDLRLVDVSRPSPRQLSDLPVDGQPVGLAHVGTVAYLAVQEEMGSSGGLYVLDVSNPAQPVQRQRLAGSVSGLLAVGRHVYETTVAPDGQWRTQVLDVSVPAAPREAATLASVSGLAASAGSVLLAIDRQGLHLFDGSNPLQPRSLGTYQIPGQFRQVAGVTVAGHDAYVTDAAGNGLHVIDISQPTHPVQVGVYALPGHANAVAVAGRYAYVADGFNMTIHVLDLANPADPVEIGSVQLGSGVEGVAVQGAYAYAALITGSLAVVDVSDPVQPRVVGSYAAPQDQTGAPPNLWTVAAAGRYAYLPDSQGALHVLDISRPTQPVEIGRYSGTIDPSFLALVGNDVYVTSGRQFLTLNVSDPTHPVLVATTILPASALAITASGTLVYIAEQAGVLTLNVADPSHPVVVSADRALPRAGAVGVGASLLWLATRTGIARVDITNPAHPTPRGTFAMGDDPAVRLLVVSNTAYAVAPFSGLFILRAAVVPMAGCQFTLGFAALHDAIPTIVGDCLDDEQHNPGSGDGLQQTTHGLLVWRKADNHTAFTDGYRTWVNGPNGVQERLNTQRFRWEANPDALPLAR